jgi:hypothetical protein
VLLVGPVTTTGQITVGPARAAVRWLYQNAERNVACLCTRLAAS